MDRTTNLLMTTGALFALLGIAGLTVPAFSTRETTEVVKIGDLKLQTQEDTVHIIPPLAAGGALVIGFVLLGGGLYRRR